jgi:type I restriction enzyme, S subunit
MHSECLPLASLGDIVRPSTEKVVANKRADWPYVGLEHLETGSPFLANSALSSVSTSTNNVFHEGDVLFGKLRPYLRKSIGAPFAGYCSTDMLVLCPNADVSPSFAAKVFQSEPVFAEAVATSIGTKMPRTSWGSLRGLEVFFPPLAEQRRIADILDTLDEAIHKTVQVIAKLQRMKQGLLHDLLTRGIDDNGELRDPERHPEQFKDSPLGRIPREWDVARFGECLDGEPQNGLYKPSSFYSVTGTPIVRIDGFYDGVLAPIRSLKRLRLASQEVNTYGLEPGNILINRVNSIEFVGKAALVPELEEPVVFESNMMRCRLRLDRLHPAFAVRWVTGSWPRRWFYRRAKSAIAQASVNQSDLTALRLPVPGLDEQGQAVELARGAERRISAETAQLDKLRALKQGLMDDLLTGRVRVPVAEDAAR